MPELGLTAGDRVVIGGASGLIGRALTSSLRADGVTVTHLVRRTPAAADEVQWDPTGPLDPDALAGARAVIGLNGASIGRLPWTAHYRSELLWSRLSPTRTLAAAVGMLGADAPHFLSASAVGWYGSAPAGVVDESSRRGRGFLSDLCEQWEGSARRAADTAAVTLLRTAPVVHPDGVLKPLIALTRAGLSGPLGRGTQVWPWISLPDVVGAVRHIIEHGLTGPVNLVSPTRTTANDIGFDLARHLNRPYVLRAPAWALRGALGEAADALLLTDARVRPAVLDAAGYPWALPNADAAIADALPAAE
ncbi:TIGR01777 family oxidoreductase [Microbacterium gorillae]|uniref:TIGR01777 family oxidoreductase n=1 Tax=Microbacterium gorillae TaxID=1231063 RepID=UPI00058C5950|nr:TIGR01777 family oxidoreductase [Microbacterium gorillae]